MADILKAWAPFSEADIANLEKRQAAPMHPYTCPEHSDVSLVPRRYGMVCKRCDYNQTWVHYKDAKGI